MAKELVPVIEAAWKDYDLRDPDLPEWARTWYSLRNHLKKTPDLTTDLFTITFPSGAKRIGYVINHLLGYPPFIDVYAKGGGDTNFALIPGILTGTTAAEIFAAITQGTNETVVNFYNPNIESITADEDIQLKCVFNIDPSKDAWDS